MIKRLTALLLALIPMIALAACAGEKKDKQDETTSQAEDTAAEETFAKAFEADKTYDIDAMAEVEYSINFGKSIDRDERVQKTKDSLREIDEEQLEEYKELLKDASFTIVDQTPLTGDELNNRIAQLEPQYNDTDKITEIIKMTYEVNFPDSDDDPRQDAVEMIKVDGTWYCYMGESTWGD